jgi:hypothetical protein
MSKEFHAEKHEPQNYAPAKSLRMENKMVNLVHPRQLSNSFVESYPLPSAHSTFIES